MLLSIVDLSLGEAVLGTRRMVTYPEKTPMVPPLAFEKGLDFPRIRTRDRIAYRTLLGVASVPRTIGLKRETDNPALTFGPFSKSCKLPLRTFSGLRASLGVVAGSMRVLARPAGIRGRDGRMGTR